MIVDRSNIFIVFLNFGLLDLFLFLVLSDVKEIFIINKIIVISFIIIWIIVFYLFKKIVLNRVVLISCIFVEIGIVLDIFIKCIDFNWLFWLKVYRVFDIKLIIIIVRLLNVVCLVVSRENLIKSVFKVVFWIWLYGLLFIKIFIMIILF